MWVAFGSDSIRHDFFVCEPSEVPDGRYYCRWFNAKDPQTGEELNALCFGPDGKISGRCFIPDSRPVIPVEILEAYGRIFVIPRSRPRMVPYTGESEGDQGKGNIAA